MPARLAIQTVYIEEEPEPHLHPDVANEYIYFPIRPGQPDDTTPFIFNYDDLDWINAPQNVVQSPAGNCTIPTDGIVHLPKRRRRSDNRPQPTHYATRRRLF